MEFATDINNVMYAYIDRKKKFPVTTLLRSIGFETDKDILLKEAARPLQSLDVPVGAMLIYNDTILSVGHNSVLLDSNVAGHAEINAINNAIRKTGFVNFSRLDRDKLILVSTFEPCMMCRGAMNMELARPNARFDTPKQHHTLNNTLREVQLRAHCANPLKPISKR